MKNGQIEKFTRFSQFQSVEEFNRHVRGWLEEHARIFSKSERIALMYLSRYAVKVVGVANVKIGTLLKTINEEYNGNGISRSTMKRMIVKAKQIGMLITHELVRENGGQSSNLYVFMRRPEPPKPEKLNPPNKTTSLKTIKEIENRNELDHSYTSEKVPQPFVKLVKCFFDSFQNIEEYWRMTEIAAYKYVYEKNQALKLDVAIQSFKQTIRKMKLSNVKKPIAYYYSVVVSKFEQEFHRELDEIEQDGTKYYGSTFIKMTH
ncbi:hypothetical protein [Anaerobacillus alkaliphilus]|nr:hypothetical protein [Anaerobacillus alkaliphilus]